jgi:hypothetical protein
MFKQRAENEKKTADSEYAKYKKAQEDGDVKAAQKHYLKSQQHYESSKENEEKASNYKDKTFKDLKGNNND